MRDDKVRDDKGGDIDSLSTDILKAILVEDLNSEPSERLSPVTIKRIVKLIRAREEDAGEYETIDVKASWEKFKAQELGGTEVESNDSCNGNGTDTTKQTRKHKAFHLRPLLKVMGAAAALVAIIFGMMITAQAAGIDVFGAIGRWTEETFHFVSAPSGVIQNSEGATPGSESFSEHQLLQAALEECGITEDLAPTWYPEGFEASEPEIINTSLSDTINVPFCGEEGQFYNIAITLYQSASNLDSYTLEKDSMDVEQYTSGTRTFYIMSNIDTITATWAGGLLVEEISGNLQIDEIKSMIDSIGG